MKKVLLISSLILFISALITDIQACTNFVLSKNGKMLYYTRNYDRDMRNAIMMVNKRGVYKRAQVATGGHKWVSQYGSITNNQYGRDFPAGGINEMGLVVEGTMLHETQNYKGPENLPGVNPGQFVQFLLDVSSSVEDAIENAKKVRYTDIWVPGHYLICDPDSCAMIEFLGDSINVYKGEDLALKVNNTYIPIRVSANSTYKSSRETLSHYKGYGDRPADTLVCSMEPQYFGAESSDETDNSLSRFVKAAHQIKLVEANMDVETFNVDSAFKAMEIIVQKGEWTRFQIVYDLQNVGLSWRSIWKANPDDGVLATPRHETIYLKDFNLNNSEPVQISNMQDPDDPYLKQDTREQPIQDLVYGEFIDYDIKFNKEIVEQADGMEINLKDKAEGYLSAIIPDAIYKTKDNDWWGTNFMRPLWYRYPEVYTSNDGYVSEQSILNFYLELLNSPLTITLNNKLSEQDYLSSLNSAAKASFSISPFSAGFSAKFKLLPEIKLKTISLFNGWDYYVFNLSKFKVESTNTYLYLYAKFTEDFYASLNLYYSYKRWIPGYYKVSVWPWKWIPGHYKTTKIPFSGSVKFKGVTFQSLGPYSLEGEDFSSCVEWAKQIVVPDYDDFELSLYGLSAAESSLVKSAFEKEIQKIFHALFFSAPLILPLETAVNLSLIGFTPFCLGAISGPF